MNVIRTRTSVRMGEPVPIFQGRTCACVLTAGPARTVTRMLTTVLISHAIMAGLVSIRLDITTASVLTAKQVNRKNCCYLNLAICMLGKIFSGQHIEIFFCYFSQKTGFDFTCKLSHNGDNFARTVKSSFRHVKFCKIK